MLVLPQKLHNLTGFFGTLFMETGCPYPRGDINEFSEIIEQICYFSSPPAPLIGVSFLISQD